MNSNCNISCSVHSWSSQFNCKQLNCQEYFLLVWHTMTIRWKRLIYCLSLVYSGQHTGWYFCSQWIVPVPARHRSSWLAIAAIAATQACLPSPPGCWQLEAHFPWQHRHPLLAISLGVSLCLAMFKWQQCICLGKERGGLGPSG